MQNDLRIIKVSGVWESSFAGQYSGECMIVSYLDTCGNGAELRLPLKESLRARLLFSPLGVALQCCGGAQQRTATPSELLASLLNAGPFSSPFLIMSAVFWDLKPYFWNYPNKTIYGVL